MAKKPETSEIKTFKEGGRGRRQCPKCKVFVGSRQSPCVCGHEFEPAPAKASKGRKAATVATIDPLKVIGLVKEFGGVAKVKKALADVAAIRAKATEAEKALDPFKDGSLFGGVEGAEKALELMAQVEAALGK